MFRSFILLAALAATGAARAEEPTALEPIVVTATRSGQPENRLPASLVVITRQQIEASGARNVVDVLRTVAGVQISGDYYGDGSTATADMRGFGLAANATTLVLVDGRRLNNPDIAPPDLASIALKDVERIEVIEGSAGTLYGDQAVGGVINIVTRRPAALAAQGSVGGGSYGAQQAGGSVSQRIGGFSYRLSGEGRGSDNYRDHNHHENENALGRAGYDYGSGSAFIEAGYVNDRTQNPGALTAAEVEADRRQCEPVHCTDYTDVQTILQRLNWDQALGSRAWSLDADLTHRRSLGKLQLSFACCGASRFTQDRDVWSLNPRVTGTFAMPAGSALATVGADGQLAGYQLNTAFGEQRDTQRTRDFYAQTVLPIVSAFEGTVGARTARVDNLLFDGFTFASPTPLSDTQNAWEAGLAWKPARAVRVFGRYDRNFRFPKADEYFSFGPVPGGGSPLKTQVGHTYELGSDWSGSRIALHGSVYRLDLHNEISFDPATFQNFNLDDTRRDGAVVQADWQLAAALKLSAAGQYLRAQLTSGPYSGNDVPLVARKTGRVAAAYDFTSDAGALLELIGTGRRPFDSDFATAAGRLPGIAVLNLAARGGWGRFRLDARVNNLLNRKYSEYGVVSFGVPQFYPSPGVNFGLALSASL